jgi:hypothetical protein
MTVAIVSKEIGQKRRVEWRVVSRLKGGKYINMSRGYSSVDQSVKVGSTVVLEHFISTSNTGTDTMPDIRTGVVTSVGKMAKTITVTTRTMNPVPKLLVVRVSTLHSRYELISVCPTYK